MALFLLFSTNLLKIDSFLFTTVKILSICGYPILDFKFMYKIFRFVKRILNQYAKDLFSYQLIWRPKKQEFICADKSWLLINSHWFAQFIYFWTKLKMIYKICI